MTDQNAEIAAAIEALPGPNGEGVAPFRSEVREGYLLAIEEAAAVARQYATPPGTPTSSEAPE